MLSGIRVVEGGYLNSKLCGMLSSARVRKGATVHFSVASSQFIEFDFKIFSTGTRLVYTTLSVPCSDLVLRHSNLNLVTYNTVCDVSGC